MWKRRGIMGTCEVLSRIALIDVIHASNAVLPT